MKSIITILLMAMVATSIYAQTNYSIGFKEKELSVQRSNQKVFKAIDISIDKLPEDDKYNTLSISFDQAKSTYPYSAFRLSKWELSKEDLKSDSKEYRLYLEIELDTIKDRDRTIVLKIAGLEGTSDAIDFKNQSSNIELGINVKSFVKPRVVSNFDHLAYLGTNFDLAQGQIESSNLFFAANVLKRPMSEYNKTGVYLSIYGNRAMTQIDSTGEVNFRRNVPLSDSTFARVNLRNEIISETITDNIGSYISPLIQIDWFQNSDNKSDDFALYYSPSLEFVWRRTAERTSFREINRDTTVVNGFVELETTNLPPETISRTYNEYAFNLGVIGLFMILENESISVRVHGSVGYSSIYSGIDSRGNRGFNHTSDIFFTGRAWITEPYTGITLQAEVNNAWNNPRPFFVATISKAFSLKDLGGIFKPITTR